MLFCLGLSGQKVSLFQLRNAPDSTYVIGADGNSVAKWVKRDSIGIGTLSRSSDSLFYKQCPSCPKAFVTLIDTSNINEMTYLNDYGSFQELVTPDGNTILFDGPAPGGVYLNLDYPNHYSILVNEGDGDSDNENGVLSRSNDSLYYQKGPSYLKTFATLIDTSNINERGTPRFSNDSLYYKACPTCTETFYGKVRHYADPDSVIGNEYGTIYKVPFTPNSIFYKACTSCPAQSILDNYGYIYSSGGFSGLGFTNAVTTDYLNLDSIAPNNFARLSKRLDGTYDLFVIQTDQDSLNELGNLRIEGDSIYYQKCPTCVDSLIGVIVHPTTIDSTTVSSTATVTLTEVSNNITANVNDGSITPAKLDRFYDPDTTNEIQYLDTFAIVSNTLRASLFKDGRPFSSVNLAPYLNSSFAINGDSIKITDGGGTLALLTPNTGPWIRSGNFTVLKTITDSVGIGTNTPFAKLDLDGNAKMRGVIDLQQSVSNNSIKIGSGAYVNSGGNNVFMGASAGAANTTGYENFFLGTGAGLSNSTGFKIVAIGANSLRNNNASYNIGIGGNTLYSNISGTENIAIGDQVLYLNTSGGSNTVAGSGAAYRNNGNNNAYFGRYTAYNVQNGERNSVFGAVALYSATNSTASYNTIMGYRAGANITGNANIIIGNQAADGPTSISNQLWIENSASASPLIFGDFAQDTMRLNSTLAVRDLTGTATSLGGYTAGNRLSKLTLGTNISITSGTINVPNNLDNDSLNERQFVDSLGFSSTNTIGASLSKDETVKTTNLRRYEHHLNSGEAEKSDNIVFVGDVEVASAAETDLKDKGVSVFRYDPDNVTLLGGSIKVDGFAGLNAVVRISPTDSISIQHYGKHLNVYARGTTDSVRVRSYDADTSFSYSFVSNAKSTIEYTNATSFVGKTPTYDKLWTSVIKADAELFIHGIIVVGYTNIIDQSKTAINLDSLYAARWEDGWNQVVLVPNPATDTVGLKQIIARNIEGTVITNNETLVRDALNKDWTAMRLTTNFNTYQRSVNEVLEDCLNENSNVYDGVTAVKNGMVFLKEGNKRYYLKRGEITGTDTLSIDGTNIYNSNGKIYNTFRTVELDSAFLSIGSETDYTVFEIGDGTSTYQQIEAYVNNDDFSKTAFMKLTDTEASIGRTGSTITLADSTSFNLSGSTGTAGQLLTATGTGKAKWQTPSFLTGSGTATRLAFWDGTTSLSSNANALWDNTNSRLSLGGSTAYSRLHVNGDFGLYKSGGAQIYLGDNAFDNGSNYNIGPGFGAMADAGVGGAAGALGVFTYNGSRLERIRILANGDIGINDTSPSYKLDVNGTFQTTGANRLVNLAGSGNRMVIADSDGDLSTQTIPTSVTYVQTTPSTGIRTADAGTATGSNPVAFSFTGGSIGYSAGSTTTGGGTITFTANDQSSSNEIQSLSAGTESGGVIPLQITSGASVNFAEGTNVNLVRTASNEIEFNVTGSAPTGSAGGDLSGTYPNPTVATSAINSAKILDNSITSSDILDATILAVDIATGAVASAEILNGNIAAEDLSSMGASTGQVMQFNGSAWTPTSIASSGAVLEYSNTDWSETERMNFTSANSSSDITTNTSSESVNMSSANGSYYLVTVTLYGGGDQGWSFGFYNNTTLLKQIYLVAVDGHQTEYSWYVNKSSLSDFNIKMVTDYVGSGLFDIYGMVTITKIY